MVYLYRNDRFTGESFPSVEAFAGWLHCTIAHVNEALLFAICHGRHFRVGQDWFHVLITEPVAVAA